MQLDSVPSGQEVTFVNLPYFFSSRGKGTECRKPVRVRAHRGRRHPALCRRARFCVLQRRPDVPTSAVTVRDAERQPGWQTFGEAASVEELRKRLATSRVFVFDLIRWRLFDLSTAWQPDVPMKQPQITLNGVQILDTQYQVSDAVVVTLTFQSTVTVPDRKVFVHIYNSSGKVAAQDDGVPAQGFVPTSWWRPGDVITDTHIVPLADLPPGHIA